MRVRPHEANQSVMDTTERGKEMREAESGVMNDEENARERWSTPLGTGKRGRGRPSQAEVFARETPGASGTLQDLWKRKFDDMLDGTKPEEDLTFKKSNKTPRSPPNKEEYGPEKGREECEKNEDETSHLPISKTVNIENKEILVIFKGMLDESMERVLSKIEGVRQDGEKNIKDLRDDLKKWKDTADRDRKEFRENKRILEENIAKLDQNCTKRNADQHRTLSKILADTTSDLKTSIDKLTSNLNENITEIKKRLHSLEVKKQDNNALPQDLQKSMQKLDNIYEENDKNRRKLNIIIKGLDVTLGELLPQVQQFLTCKFATSHEDIDKVWKINSTASENTLIAVKFKLFASKLNILRRKKEVLKDTNTYIENDLTPKERRIGKHLRDKGREERSKGKQVLIRNEKIKIDNEWMRWNDVSNSLEPSEPTVKFPSTHQKVSPKNGQLAPSTSKTGI